MYCARPVARRAPATLRIIPTQARNASFFPSPFFPRSPAAEFNTLFRALDDLSNPRNFSFDNVFAPAYAHHARIQQSSFAPKFDVQEHAEGYELRGELPGVEGKDLSVEFTDPQTLIIKGQTTQESTSDTPIQAQAQPEAANAVATEATQTTDIQPEARRGSDAGSIYSTGSYQKPSVEDEGAEAGSSTDAQARLTPTTSEAGEQPQVEQTPLQAQPEQQQVAQVAAQPQQPSSRYWISERSTGSFQRTFKFQSRVDQDAVTASLRNGILNVVVPKAKAPEARRIQVE